MTATVLVVAKAAVPGLAKTRLIPAYGVAGAARLAAAALLDTLAAATAVADCRCVVAVTGDLEKSQRRGDILAALRRCTVIAQVPGGFGTRLAAAHLAAAPGTVLQIGMDTPQVTPDLLAACLHRLAAVDAALGPADDGGWWALGLHDGIGAHVLPAVPMSAAHTGVATRRALAACGLDVADLPALRDVDVPADVVPVAQTCRVDGEFARAVRELTA
ncbi:TIGR04282 family arsenosugar biosynthesis glycosyltransferase [Tsukamurella soli]|uniref:DUF2064 domain-containing protein n=1 Tax=Tsukamurella soli TaxID=644556 RepID=A0ABP8JN87_9ACTN